MVIYKEKLRLTDIFKAFIWVKMFEEEKEYVGQNANSYRAIDQYIVDLEYNARNLSEQVDEFVHEATRVIATSSVSSTKEEKKKNAVVDVSVKKQCTKKEREFGELKLDLNDAEQKNNKKISCREYGDLKLDF